MWLLSTSESHLEDFFCFVNTKCHGFQFINCELCKFHVLCEFDVIEINIFDATFAFVSFRFYVLKNWLILADYLVKLAGQFLNFNHLYKYKEQISG